MKKKHFILLFVSILTFGFMIPGSFKTEQKKASRVKEAYKLKEKKMNQLLNAKGIDTLSFEIFLRAFKRDKLIEVWAKNRSQEIFTHILDYEICSSSGSLGPKRKQGDYQVPEGFYHIDRFNP